MGVPLQVQKEQDNVKDQECPNRDGLIEPRRACPVCETPPRVTHRLESVNGWVGLGESCDIIHMTRFGSGGIIFGPAHSKYNRFKQRSCSLLVILDDGASTCIIAATVPATQCSSTLPMTVKDEYNHRRGGSQGKQGSRPRIAIG